MEWVEAEGKTVEVAVEAAIAELGITREEADVEVLQEPKVGFLGLGGQDAVVKVVRKPKTSGKKRRRRRSKGTPKKAADKNEGRGSGAPQGKKPAPGKRREPKDTGPRKREESAVTAPDVSIEEQGELAKEFLVGLLGAFGLEGEVTTRVDDDVLYIDVTGAQTEALVGAKGSILQAIHELTRTVIQRKTFRAPRMRIDIAGYAERRRAALKIFAAQVADKVLQGGGEVMLEPMNPADRKVLHDAVAEIDGVRSFSEGEDPRRSVVIAPVDDDD
jgi:spoIIIJ-associated protein